MKKAGTLDKAAAAALPPVEGTPIVPTQADAESRQDLPRRQLGQRRWLTPRARRALGRRRPSSALLGVVPFFAYTTVFLLIPTLVVLVGAFLDGDNGFTLANVAGAHLSRPCCGPCATPSCCRR